MLEFEKVCEDLGVKAEAMGETLDIATASTVDLKEVL